MRVDIERIIRETRSHYIRVLLKAAGEKEAGDPEFAARIREDALALKGEPALEHVRFSGRLANHEIMISRAVDRAVVHAAHLKIAARNGGKKERKSAWHAIALELETTICPEFHLHRQQAAIEREILRRWPKEKLKPKPGALKDFLHKSNRPCGNGSV